MSIRSVVLGVSLASLLLYGGLGVGCGGGGGAPAPEPPAEPAAVVGEDLNAVEERALPPVIVSLQGLPSTVEVGEVVRFSVTARVRQFRDDERVTIALQNPPPGCTCPTVENAGVSATAVGRWVVNSLWSGPIRLQFRIATAQSGVFRRSFDVQVVGTRFLLGRELTESAGARVGDVTGDGLLDVVALATKDGPGDAGALYVFAGGATLATAPTATLRDPLGSADDRLGTDPTSLDGASESAYVHLVDITRDGILDVVVALPFSDRGAVDAGAILIWRGGPTLAGAASPFAVLQASTPVAGAKIGHDRFWSSILFADVVGDGALDVVAAAPADTTAPSLQGSVLAWQGGPALAAVAPGSVVAETARFTAPDVLEAPTCGEGPLALRSADVTGDGRNDLVVSGWLVFAGGSGVTGVRLPTATLPALGTLGETTYGIGWRDGIRLGDVTGDGIADIVRKDSTPFAGENRSFGSVWRGGPGLVGDLLPQHRLADAIPGDADDHMFNGFRLHDVTGDGVLDVLAVAPKADAERGEVRVWTAAHMTGFDARPVLLRASSAGAKLGLGILITDELTVEDVTGDGIDDILVPQGAPDVIAGRIEVFAGGAALEGAPLTVLSPTFSLETQPGPDFAPARMGDSQLQVEDLDGDGRRDVVWLNGPLSSFVDVWRGRDGASGVIQPDRHLDVALLAPSSMLNTLSDTALALQIADVDRDGRPDVAVLRNPTTSATSPVAQVFFGATIFSAAPTSVSVALGITQDVQNDLLAQGLEGLHGARVPLLLADLTGDRRLELIGAAPRLNAVGGESGMVAVWNVHAQMTTTTNPFGLPTHRVVGSATAGRHLPGEARGPQGILVADLTGDGVVELLVIDPLAASGDGEISFVRGAVAFPTAALGGVSGRFFAGSQADGLGR